jgi:hypothetical protein
MGNSSMDTMSKANASTWIVVVAAVCVVILGLGGLAALAASTKERGEMSQEATDLAQGGRMPPIDAAAPARKETATFALG